MDQVDKANINRNMTAKIQNDANIFLTSLVPIQILIGKPHAKQNIILWQNPRTSSTRFCKPIRFQFIHKTVEILITEKEYIGSQIKNLKPTTCNINNKIIQIKHKLLFTM